MDSYDQLNELVTILQKWRDLTNTTQNTHLPPIEPRDVMEMVNQYPDALQDVINVARADPRTLGLTESIPDEFTANYVSQLHDDWRFLPSDYNIQERDYNSVVEYFQGRKQFSDLMDQQQDLVSYLTYEADDFTVDSGLFAFDHDGANAYNLQEQLYGRLERDGILTKKLVRQANLGPGEQWPEDFDYSFLSLEGTQVPGVSGTSSAQRPGGQGVEMQELGPKDATTMFDNFFEDGVLPDDFNATSVLVDQLGITREQATSLEYADLAMQLEDIFFDRIASQGTGADPTKVANVMRRLLKGLLKTNNNPTVEETMEYGRKNGLHGKDLQKFARKVTQHLEEIDELFGPGGDVEMQPLNIQDATGTDIKTNFDEFHALMNKPVGELTFEEWSSLVGDKSVRQMVYDYPDKDIRGLYEQMQTGRDGTVKPSDMAMTPEERLGQRFVDMWRDEIAIRDSYNNDPELIKQRSDELDMKPFEGVEDAGGLHQGGLDAPGGNQDLGDPGKGISDEAALHNQPKKNPFDDMTSEQKKAMLNQMAEDGVLKDGARLDSEGNIFITEEGMFDWMELLKGGVKQLLWIPAGMALSQFASMFGSVPGQVMNVGLAIYGLSQKDPSGMILFAISKLVEEAGVQNQRRKDSQHPEGWRGKFYGKMLIETPEGEKWVPAITTALDKHYGGTGDRGDTISLGYSPSNSAVLWEDDGMGSMRPYFPDEIVTDYQIDDDVLNYSDHDGWAMPTGTHARRAQNAWQTGFRGFYLYEDDVVEKMLGGDSDSWETFYEDDGVISRDSLNGVMQNVQDMRRGLSIANSWQNQNLKGQGADVGRSSADRAFAQLENPGRWYSYLEDPSSANYTSDVYTDEYWSTQFAKPDSIWGGSGTYDKNPWRGVIWDDVLPYYMENLIRTQKKAFISHGFDPKQEQVEADRAWIYEHRGRSGTWEEQMNSDWLMGREYWDSYGILGKGEQTRATAGYDLPKYHWDYADTADDLKTILDEITALDIPTEDRDFLGQKNIMRFWMNQASKHGMEQQVVDSFVTWDRNAGALNQWVDQSTRMGWNKLPWQNYGEEDIMPDLYGRLSNIDGYTEWKDKVNSTVKNYEKHPQDEDYDPSNVPGDEFFTGNLVEGKDGIGWDTDGDGLDDWLWLPNDTTGWGDAGTIDGEGKDEPETVFGAINDLYGFDLSEDEAGYAWDEGEGDEENPPGVGHIDDETDLVPDAADGFAGGGDNPDTMGYGETPDATPVWDKLINDLQELIDNENISGWSDHDNAWMLLMSADQEGDTYAGFGGSGVQNGAMDLMREYIRDGQQYLDSQVPETPETITDETIPITDETIPITDETIPEETIPPAANATQNTPHLTQFGEYLLHEHMGDFQNVVQGAVDINDLLNQMPITATGELAIGGDEQLESDLNLSPDVRAVTVGGEVQTRMDPYQAGDIKEQMSLHHSSHTLL